MRRPFMIEFTGTPEAGETTVITNVSNQLTALGYRVFVLKESAEKLPRQIPKGTWDANLWMHYQTMSGILNAKYIDTDIVLIDRGLVDSNFYGKRFLWNNLCTKEKYEKFRNQFIDELFPDFLVALIVSPDIALKRRGGEGTLVNEEYIKKYNELFLVYYEQIKFSKVLIDTSKLNVYEMNSAIFSEIQKILP